MTMFYDSLSRGFYNSDDNVTPKTAKPISDDVYNTLLLQQLNGKQIVPDENGFPICVDHIVESHTYLVLRANEYPPLTDLADAMYWSSQGDNTKLEAYYAACEAVKLKYPKATNE